MRCTRAMPHTYTDTTRMFPRLLAVVICCVDNCFGSWVLLGFPSHGDWKCYISSRSAMRISLPCGPVRIPRSISGLRSRATNKGLIKWPPQLWSC